MQRDWTRLLWLWLAVAIIVVDQLSKVWALEVVGPKSPWNILPFFDLTLAFNTGAAFSFLANAGGWQTWLFNGLALVVTLLLSHWLTQTSRGARLLPIAYALVIGGAWGNVIDRIRLGKVVDFFDFYWGQYHWPIFNVADIAICVGVGLLILDSVRQQEPKHDA